MKKVLFISMALVLTVLLGAPMLLAQEKFAPEAEKVSCKKEMKLTDDQAAKLEELKSDFRLKTIDLNAEREKLGIALKKEMAKDEPGMQAVTDIVKKMSAVREKVQLARIEHALAVRKLLGPLWRGHMEGGEGGCMMDEPGMSPGPHMSVERGGCMMMQKGGACRQAKGGNWNHMMFRPNGKRGCCSGMDRGMECMGAGRDKDAMRGCCTEMGAPGKGARGKHRCKMECMKEGREAEKSKEAKEAPEKR